MPRKLIETKDDPRKQIGVEAPVKQTADSRLRTLLFHFHIFKNGGSTLDAALKKNFGNRWRAIEGPDPGGPMNWSLAMKLVRARHEIEAVSSHTARFTAPSTPGLKIVQIFLIRHPIDRLCSIYHYKTNATTSTANKAFEIAQKSSFEDFMEFALANQADIPSAVCDAQISWLARAGIYQKPPSLADLDKAKSIVAEALVPGVVERMDQYLFRIDYFSERRFRWIKFEWRRPRLAFCATVERRNYTFSHALRALDEQA